MADVAPAAAPIADEALWNAIGERSARVFVGKGKGVLVHHDVLHVGENALFVACERSRTPAGKSDALHVQ